MSTSHQFYMQTSGLYKNSGALKFGIYAALQWEHLVHTLPWIPSNSHELSRLVRQCPLQLAKIPRIYGIEPHPSSLSLEL